MMNLLKYIVGILVTSFYLFPFHFSFLPAINTKIIVALWGFIPLVKHALRAKEGYVDKRLIILFGIAGSFSLLCFLSAVVNGSSDYEYVTYIMSMSLWLMGALGVCDIIKKLFNKISVELIADFLILTCLLQCILAILIDNSISLQNFVDRLCDEDYVALRKIHRLYGIGAFLDVAGTKFAAVIATIIYYISFKGDQLTSFKQWFYPLALILILILGNMIARTTTIGLVIGVMYIILRILLRKDTTRIAYKKTLIKGGVLLVIAVVTSVATYGNSDKAHDLFRFAFEGFFSLAEQGQWQVDSNDKLQTMIVFPDNARTWIVGDGYINNPSNNDPNFIGEITKGNFYKATDIGYLRFIFYCGIIGLIAFMLFMAYSCIICSKRDVENTWLYIILLTLNYAIWFKVATDIFLFFALFICNSYLQDEITELEEVENIRMAHQ